METEETVTGKFAVGRLYLTPGVICKLTPQDVLHAVRRHMQGDWGEVNEEDWEENELSLREGFRLLSAYRGSNGCRFWIITEHDRSATTVLLPEEY